MFSLLYATAKICGGLLLGISILDKWDGDSNFFNKIAKVLVPFETVIGGTLVVFAILTFRGSILHSVLSIIGGVLLLTDVFEKVPALETSLRQLSAKLMPFKAVIGIALLVFGVLQLF